MSARDAWEYASFVITALGLPVASGAGTPCANGATARISSVPCGCCCVGKTRNFSLVFAAWPTRSVVL